MMDAVTPWDHGQFDAKTSKGVHDHANENEDQKVNPIFLSANFFVTLLAPDDGGTPSLGTMGRHHFAAASHVLSQA